MSDPVGREVDRVSVRILPDTSRFLIDLEKYLKRIESRVKVNIPTSLNTTGLEAEARRAATLIEQTVDVDVPVDADTSLAELKLAEVARTRTAKIEVDTSSFSVLEALTGNVAKNIGKFTAFGGKSGGLAFLGSGGVEGLAVIATQAAQAAGAVGVLASALVSAGGAAGILGVAVAGQVAEMVLSQKAIKDAADDLDKLTPGTAEYAQQLAALTDLQRTFNREFGPAAAGLDHLKVAWSGFLEATRTSVVALMGKTLDAIANILPKLTPTANAAAVAVGGLVDEFARFTEGNEFARFLDWLATTGVDNLVNFSRAVGNLTVGFGSILGAFTPFASAMTEGLVGLTGEFRKWADEAARSGQLADFAAGSIEALQQLASLVADVAGSFVAIGRAAQTATGGIVGGIGPALDGLNDFLNSNRGQASLVGFFKGLNEGFVALAKAAKPVGAALEKVLPALGHIIGDIGERGAAIIGALAPVFGALAKPLQVLSGVLTGAFVGVIKAIAPAFVQLAQALGPQIVQFAKGLAPLLPGLAKAFGDLALALSDALVKALPQLAPALLSLMQAIIPLLPVLVDDLVPAIVSLGPAMSELLKMVPGLVAAFVPLLTAAVGLVKPLAEILAAILSIPGVTTLAAASLLPLRIALVLLTPVLNAISGALQIVADVLNGDFRKAFRDADKLVGGTLTAIIVFLDKTLGKLSDAIDKARELAGLLPGVDANPGNLIATGHALGGNTTYNYTVVPHDYNDFIRHQHDARRRHAVGGVALTGTATGGN